MPSRGIEGSMKTWCKCYRLNNGVRLSPIFYIKSCPKVFIFFASAQISLTYLNHIVSKCTIYCVVDFWSLTNEGFWAEGWWGGEGGGLPVWRGNWLWPIPPSLLPHLRLFLPLIASFGQLRHLINHRIPSWLLRGSFEEKKTGYISSQWLRIVEKFASTWKFQILKFFAYLTPSKVGFRHCIRMWEKMKKSHKKICSLAFLRCLHFERKLGPVLECEKFNHFIQT